MKQGLKSGKDPRVRYTKKILRDSLIELMKQRPVTEIGIKEICAAAEVSRSTFYTYYDGVYNLLEEIEAEVFDYFDDIANQYSLEAKKCSKRGEYTAILQRNLQYIADNSNSLQTLLSENGDIGFQKKFFQKAIAYAWKVIQDNSDHPEDVYINEGHSVFVVHGAIGLTQYWLKNNMHIPIPELAKLLAKLSVI